MKEEIKYERKYLGVIVSSHNYKQLLKNEGKDGIRFHNKHLKAYIKGRPGFTHGKDKEGKAIWYDTQEKLSKINLSKSK